MKKKYDVIIIGAGPAGCATANLLAIEGKKVLVIEKSIFPRFTLGESLLPQSMEFFKKCGLEDVFKLNCFRFKNGAQFLKNSKFRNIEFKDSHLKNVDYTTFQVRRDIFDKELTTICEKNGVTFLFGAEVVEILEHDSQNETEIVLNNDSKKESYYCDFLGDASGFARVVSKIKGHSVTYLKDYKVSAFNHIITDKEVAYDNNKILIAIDRDITGKWFWVIPLGENRYSFGVTVKLSDVRIIDNKETLLINSLEDNPYLKEVLGDFKFLFNHNLVENYTAFSEKMYGDRFVLIGNSKEFIDPVFSSGVTIGLKSGYTVANLILKKLRNEYVDWEKDYIEPQKKSIEIFRAFIDSWYEGKLQEIFYSEEIDQNLYQMIVSVLAGYVWDESNVFYNKDPHKIIDSLYRYVSHA